MKKSEFIDRLYLEMNKRLVGRFINDREFVEEMVCIIESIGMLPPCRASLDDIISNTTDDSYCNLITYCTWEPEDEEK